MLTIILMFTSLLVQTYTIPVNEDEDTSVIAKGRYNFNHPPTVEEYNPILESIKYSETTDYRPRIYKEVGDYERELVTDDNISAETVPDKIEDDDAKAIKKIELKSEHKTNEEKSLAVTQPDHGDKLKGRQKSAIRKTKVLKRIIQQSVANDNSFKQNINKPKPSNFQTTTLKPTVTTVRVTNKPKASTEVYSVNLKERRQRDPVVPIVESENYVYAHNGNFFYSYVGGDGTKASEQGQLKVFDDETAGEAVVGSFSYTDKDGNEFSLTYTADENGYRPVGDHLPTPPPIPPAIARALQYLSTKRPPESTTKF